MLLPAFQKKDSSNSLDSASLIDVDSSDEGGKEKGRKKSRGLRVCGVRVGRKEIGRQRERERLGRRDASDWRDMVGWGGRKD